MAEVTNVRVNINNYATAMRSHLNAAMAYMRLGMGEEMDLEFDSMRKALDLLESQAYENVRS